MQTFKLLPHDTVMLLQPQLVKQFGRAGALLLSQLHYWLNKKDSLGCSHQGNRWIYNTAEEWAEQLQLSARYVRQLFAKMADIGIVKIEKLHKIKSVRTNYYSIDYDQLHKFIGTEDSFANRPAEIITGPLGKNNLMYNDTKTTNKDFNKSDKFEKNLGVDDIEVARNLQSGQRSQNKQVSQVKNINLKSEKVLEITHVDAIDPFANKNLLQEQLVDSSPDNLVKNSLVATNTKQASPTDLIITKTTPLAIKTSTTQDMLKAWNEIFQDKASAKLSKAIAPLLVAAFKTKFESNFENWKTYCNQIKSSSYLMADTFKLTIAWALKFATIDRITSGDLGVKLNTIGQGSDKNPVAYDEIQISQMIDDLAESNTSKALRHKIAKAIGSANYHSWFHPAKFCEQNGDIRLVAPNAFVEQYWEKHFEWILKK